METIFKLQISEKIHSERKWIEVVANSEVEAQHKCWALYPEHFIVTTKNIINNRRATGQNKSPGQGPLNKMKYAFYADPSHGWLKVSIEEIKQLGIIEEITGYSYVSPDGKYAYLEEDQDTQTFIAAILSANWFENMEAIRRCTKEFHSNSSSFIRNLDSFDASRFSNKLKTEQIKIFQF